jgi:hypothetical protein
MFSNRRFELVKPVLVLDPIVRQGWITIPAGEIIRVLRGPIRNENEMLDVLWDGRMLTMLAIDLTVGCKEITEQQASGSRDVGTSKSRSGGSNSDA